MGTEPGGWTRRWVAGALGGTLLLGVIGARSVPPPPPLVKAHARPTAAVVAPAPEPETATGVEPAPAEEDPNAGPALIWLLPMAGQLSGAPTTGE